MFVSINNLTNQQKISGTKLTKYKVYPLIQSLKQLSMSHSKIKMNHGRNLDMATLNSKQRFHQRAHTRNPKRRLQSCGFSLFLTNSQPRTLPLKYLFPLWSPPPALRSLFFTFFSLAGFEVSLALRKTSCCSSSWDYHLYV